MGWANKPGIGARTVVDAFRNRQAAKVGRFATDGDTYFLYGSPIAKHVDVPVPDQVAHTLLHNEPLRLHAYQFVGHEPGDVVSNHLQLLGVLAYNYGTPHMNGKTVRTDRWYTLAELQALPDDEPEPERPARPTTVRGDVHTLELFPT